MGNWQRHSLTDQMELLTLTSQNTGINLNAVEKDWWVTVTLKALSQTSCANNLLFKGGTSLSKGWNIIERFSEDIDLALDHTFFGIDGKNGSQRKKLRKKSRRYIHGTLSDELKQQLNLMGINNFTIENVTNKTNERGEDIPISSESDPTVILVNYESIIEEQIIYIPPRVKIEISCLSMAEPSEQREIKSLIYDYFPEEDDETKSFINTVLPARTFLEKAFLLSEEFQKENPRYLRMSRHLYDLEKLMHTPFSDVALSDPQLYVEIVKHRSTYNHLGYVDYNLHHPSTINFCPTETVRDKWESDYNDMKVNFIYGESPSFDELLEAMDELKSKFQLLNIQAPPFI